MCPEFSNARCLIRFSTFKDFQNQMLHRIYLGQNKVTKPACAIHIIGMDQSIEQLPSTAHYIFYLSAPLIWCHHCTVTRYILGNQYNSFESSCIYYLWFSARRQICSRFLHPQDICNCPEDGIPGTGHTLWETWRVSLTMSMTSPHTSKILHPLSPSTPPRIRTAIHPNHPAKRQKLLTGTLHVQRRMEFSPFRDQILMVLSIPQLAILRTSDGWKSCSSPPSYVQKISMETQHSCYSNKKPLSRTILTWNAAPEDTRNYPGKESVALTNKRGYCHENKEQH